MSQQFAHFLIGVHRARDWHSPCAIFPLNFRYREWHRAETLGSNGGFAQQWEAYDHMDQDEGAPLEIIRRKERELAQRLRDAELRVREKLAAARARAAEIKNEAERCGQVEAEEFFREGIARVEKAAAAIGEAASRDAEQLMRIGEKQMDRAAQIVVDFIFPK
jgi:vacuolar-type H+-ATPase subunit H